MSNSPLKTPSLRSLAARAIPLTLGAATLFVIALIFGAIVYAATTQGSPQPRFQEQLVLRKDGQLVVMKTGGMPTVSELRSLDGERLPSFASTPVPVTSVSFETPLVEYSSADAVTLGTESLWKRTTSNHHGLRVQPVAGYQIQKLHCRDCTVEIAQRRASARGLHEPVVEY